MKRVIVASQNTFMQSMLYDFLEWFCQCYGELSYSDIMALDSNWDNISNDTKNEIQNCAFYIRDACNETGMDAYEASQAYDDVYDKCTDLVGLVHHFKK